MSLPDVE